MATSRKRCFVIMPFSETTKEHTEEYWANHFETFLKPHIEDICNLEAVRSEALRGDVLKQIIANLAVSPIVVADLTDKNPNVFWELGVRQSSGIALLQSLKKILEFLLTSVSKALYSIILKIT